MSWKWLWIKRKKEGNELELQGEVIEIIYKNDINSYCIAVLKLDKESKEIEYENLTYAEIKRLFSSKEIKKKRKELGKNG